MDLAFVIIMLVLFSGEGITDLGQADPSSFGVCAPGQWKPGPLAYLADQIYEKELDYSLIDASAYFVPESVLTQMGKKLRHPGLRGTGGNLYHRKGSQALASLAIAMGKRFGQPVVAVFFRDCDGSNASNPGWDALHASINGERGGFSIMGLKTGVPMLPMPKSEAWLLCALKNHYQNCNNLERTSGNDRSPNSLKSQLKDCIGEYTSEQLCRLMRNEHGNLYINSSKIDMPSYNNFRQTFINAIKCNACQWIDTDRANQSLRKHCIEQAEPYLASLP